MQPGQCTYFTQLSQQQSAQNQNDLLPNSRTSVQRDRSPGIISVQHHRQAAHPNSSSKAQAILLTKIIMHVKLLAYILNSVWFHFVMVHSSSKFPYSCSSDCTGAGSGRSELPCYSVCTCATFDMRASFCNWNGSSAAALKHSPLCTTLNRRSRCRCLGECEVALLLLAVCSRRRIAWRSGGAGCRLAAIPCCATGLG